MYLLSLSSPFILLSHFISNEHLVCVFFKSIFIKLWCHTDIERFTTVLWWRRTLNTTSRQIPQKYNKMTKWARGHGIEYSKEQSSSVLLRYQSASRGVQCNISLIKNISVLIRVSLWREIVIQLLITHLNSGGSISVLMTPA